MKKSNLVITLAVALILAVSSVGAVLATTGVFAAGGGDAGVQSTQGAIQFDAPSGIRWNNGKNAFEIFNYAGITYIASEQFVNAIGDVISPTTYTGLGAEQATYKEMNGVSTYHIMQDIVYEDTTAIFEPHRNNVSDFGHDGAGGNVGVLDGRGFGLFNFPVKKCFEFPTWGSNLFATQYGTIKNLNIFADNVRIEGGVTSVSITCRKLAGTISNSHVEVEFEDTILFRLYPFSVYVDATGLISGCSSKITGDATFAAGITGYVEGMIVDCVSMGKIGVGNFGGGICDTLAAGSSLLRCLNLSDVTAITEKTKIAGIVSIVNDINTIKIIGCTNAGEISGGAANGSIATGICGAASVTNVIKTDNVNVGALTGAVTYPLYYGVA